MAVLVDKAALIEKTGADTVGALGYGLPKHPALGVRGIDLDQADPLRGEWDVAVIGSHFAIAFVAWEGRAREPMIPLRLFNSRAFACPIRCGRRCEISSLSISIL